MVRAAPKWYESLCRGQTVLRLDLKDDGAVEREVRLARVETLRAAVAATAGRPGAETAALVRQRYEVQLRSAEGAIGRDGAGANTAGPCQAATQAGDGDEALSVR